MLQRLPCFDYNFHYGRSGYGYWMNLYPGDHITILLVFLHNAGS